VTRAPLPDRRGTLWFVRYEELDERDQAWVRANERLWQRAHAIVALHPTLDVSLVYHTLVNLRRTPEERLARGLVRGSSAAH
jgi:hypothetical protein